MTPGRCGVSTAAAPKAVEETISGPRTLVQMTLVSYVCRPMLNAAVDSEAALAAAIWLLMMRPRKPVLYSYPREYGYP